jgi:four helix bundle protein
LGIGAPAQGDDFRGKTLIRSFKDLEVWQKSMDLVVEVYRLTKTLPADERFGLTSQIRRAASSVAANIAEGHGRTHRLDYLRFLSIARGSLSETQTHLLIAERLEYLTAEHTERVKELADSVGRLLNKLIQALARKS